MAAPSEALPKWQKYAADEYKDHDSWDDKTPYECPDDVPFPKYASDGAAGIDLAAAEPGTIKVGKMLEVKTGIRVGFQEGHYGMIASRSGLYKRSQIMAFPGIIDNDYRGEIIVMLYNHGENDFSFSKGERIAQMVVCPLVRVDLVRVTNVDDIRGATARGADGFGSTGK